MGKLRGSENDAIAMKRIFLPIPSLSALALMVGLAACSPSLDVVVGTSSSSKSPKLGGGATDSSTELDSDRTATKKGRQFDLLELPNPSNIPLTNTGELSSGQVVGSSYRTELGLDNVSAHGTRSEEVV